MPVLMDGQLVTPAPLPTINVQPQVADDGTILGQSYQITLKGSIVAVPPGTTAVAEPARLGVLLSKQDILKSQFKTGRTFEIYSPDGTNIIKCNPKVISIEFAEGIWVDRTEYTIVLETPYLYPGDYLPTEFVTDIRDQWGIEEAGYTIDGPSSIVKPIWQLTHTVGATGKLVYDSNGNIDPEKVAWKQARDWVIRKLSTSNFDTKPFDTKGEMGLISGGQGYNHSRTEDVDVITGSFSISEKWVLALGLSATEEYTISINRTPEEAVGTVVTINGNVHGLSLGLNDLNTRIDKAVTYFNTNVKNNLIVRAREAVPEITLSDYGTNGSLDYNYTEGTITYNYSFNDKPTPTSTDTVYDMYTVSRKSSIDEMETSVTVQGTITGRLKVTEPYSFLLKYERAKTYWDALYGSSAILDRANTSGVANLKPSALQGSVDFNTSEGTITYSYDFNNRPDDIARNEYTTSMRTSRDEARTNITVEGTITGLKQRDDDPITRKYDNALSYWSTWEPQIRVKANQFVPTTVLNPSPISRTRGDNPRQGTINYSYEYNTDKIPTIIDALYEQITITDVKPADVFAVIPVLGRTAGPVLQNIGSKKEKSRNLSLEVTMKLGAARPNTDNLVNTYQPSGRIRFIDRDEESWMENIGRYTRNITWVYE